MWSLIEVLMPEYLDGQTANTKQQPTVLAQETKETKIDVNAIAEAVVKALGGKLPISNTLNYQNSQNVDDFDNSASLAKLADAMSNTKNNEGVINNIGIIKETKKDDKETKNTIDLLSNLED